MKLCLTDKKLIARLREIKKEEEERGNSVKFSVESVKVTTYNCLKLIIGESEIGNAKY